MTRSDLPGAIRNDEELDALTEELLRLDELESPTPEEKEIAEDLTNLIEAYEQEHYPIREATQEEIDRFLLEQQTAR